VNASVWRGASTRLVVSVHGLPDQLLDVDVPGASTHALGTEIGLRFPEPAGVLVQST